MERLTCYFDNETAVARECCTFDRESDTEPDDCISCGEMCEEKDGDCSECPIQKAFNKLAEYEDLEEKGLLMKLPCKVGDIVYKISHKYTQCSFCGEYRDICYAACNEKCDSKRIYNIEECHADSLEWIVKWLNHFGNTIFLDREEAEQSMKETEETRSDQKQINKERS